MKLDLDWTLNTPEERKKFVSSYIEKNSLVLTEANLETLSNYILWSIQDPDFELERKDSTWSKKKKEVSLEGLLEDETKSNKPVESLIQGIALKKASPKLKRDTIIKRLWLDKSEPDLLNLLSPHWHVMTSTWFSLWAQIDICEYGVQFWEMKNGQRRGDLPIRDELIARLQLISGQRAIDEGQLKGEIESKTLLWSASHFLKEKRKLVSLRQQQYQLLDSLMGETLRIKKGVQYVEEDKDKIELIAPFDAPELMIEDVNQECFQKKFQEVAISQLRELDKFKESYSCIDLRNPQAIRAILSYMNELEDSALEANVINRQLLVSLYKYVQYYLGKAELTPELICIRDMKMKGCKNKEIVEAIKNNFGITYKENYISTIYTKRIIQAIVDAVEKHVRLIEYITMGRSVFKICARCGKMLPRNSEYFNKRSSALDGYFPHCKDCRN